MQQLLSFGLKNLGTINALLNTYGTLKSIGVNGNSLKNFLNPQRPRPYGGYNPYQNQNYYNPYYNHQNQYYNRPNQYHSYNQPYYNNNYSNNRPFFNLFR